MVSDTIERRGGGRGSGRVGEYLANNRVRGFALVAYNEDIIRVPVKRDAESVVSV